MPENSNATFNEVLGVEIQTSGFESGLAKLTEIYTQWLNDTSDKGLDGSTVLGAGSITQVTDLLATLSTQFSKVQESMAALSESILEGFEKASSADQDFSDKAVANATKVAEAQKAIQEARQFREYTGADTKLTGKSSDDLVATQQAAIQQKRDVEQATALGKQLEAEQKAADEIIAIQQKREVEQATLLGKQMEAEERAAAEIVAIQEKAAAEIIAIQQKRDVETATSLGKKMAAEDKAAAEVIAIQEKAAEEIIRIQQRRDVEQAELIGKQMEAEERAANARIELAEKEAARIKEIQQKRDYETYVAKGEGVEESESRSGGKYSNLTSFLQGGSISEVVSGFGKSVLTLATFQIEMAAATKVIELAISPITLFIDTVKGGFTYLEDFQNRSSIIQEALLQSVQFSKNWAENVHLAGEEADSLVRKVDELAIKLRVSSQAVQTGLTSFLEYGGRNLTGSVDEALQVSGLVTGALQSQNPNLDNRKLTGEMQKFVQGATQDSDKLAAALGLSSEQMKAIVGHAKEYHDLYQEILAAAPGLAERIGDANDRETTLVATLELYQARWEALIAGPLFKEFTAILKEVLDYIDQHSAKINQIAAQIGTILGDVVRLGLEFGKLNAHNLVEGLKIVAGITVDLISQFTALVNIVTAFGKANLDVLSGDIPKAIKDIKSALGGDDHPVLSGLSQLQEDIRSVGTTVDGAKPEAPNTPINPIQTKQPAGAEKGVKLDYQEELDDTKQFYQDQLDEEKNRHAEGIINLQQYTDTSVSLLKQEKAEVDALIAKYKDLAEKKAPAGQRENAGNAFDVLGKNFDRSNTKSQDELVEANEKDKTAADLITAKGAADLNLQKAKEELETYKQSGASQLEYAKAVTAEHEAAYKITRQELLDKISVAHDGGDAEQEATANNALIKLNSDYDSQSKKDAIASQVAGVKALNDVLSEYIKLNNESLASDEKKYEQDVKSADISTSPSKKAQSDSDLYEQKIALDKEALATTQANIIALQQEADSEKGVAGEEENRRQILEKIAALKEKAKDQQNQIANDNKTVNPESLAKFEQVVFSDSSLQQLSDVFTNGFAQGATDLTNAFDTFGTTIKNAFAQYNAGFKEGGVIGGIGAVLSGGAGKLIGQGATGLGTEISKESDDGTGLGGLLGDAAGPVSGILSAAAPFISAIGPAFQLIGDLFTAAAKKTAEEMQKQFSLIQTNYSEGNINLSEAISQEQSTINQTISSLSGEKGGQGELDAILPGMQQSLSALQEQQKQIFTQMDESVANLQLQQSYLQSTLSTWTSINDQVTQYVQAGGSLATAAEFISQSLEAQKLQAAQDLESAEASAVQNAQSYNNLLIQRTQLIEQYNQQAFGEKNADSIERSQAGAVVRASQLEQDTTTYQQSLEADNQQITQQGAQVAAAQQIFGIATDTASLQAESNTLALESLQQQVIQWQSIQQIYNGIVQNAQGQYTYTSALGTLLGFTSGFGNAPTGNYNGPNVPIPGQPSTGLTASPVGNSPIGVGTSSLGTGPALPTPKLAQNSLSIGNVTVNISSSGGTIDAASIADTLQAELISRNQYAGSSYYS